MMITRTDQLVCVYRSHPHPPINKCLFTRQTTGRWKNKSSNNELPCTTTTHTLYSIALYAIERTTSAATTINWWYLLCFYVIFLSKYSSIVVVIVDSFAVCVRSHNLRYKIFRTFITTRLLYLYFFLEQILVKYFKVRVVTVLRKWFVLDILFLEVCMKFF